MIFNVQTKISPNRLKQTGERLTRAILKSGFCGDIEIVGLLQEMLFATGANPIEIQDEITAQKENEQ